MPLTLHHKFQDGAGLAVWRYDEEEDFFAEKIRFNDYDKEQLSAISHPSKRREWLASRYLVRFLIDIPEPIQLEKDPFGKPRLVNVPGFMSLSHCKDYAAAIYHPLKRVGVDVEPFAPTVLKIAQKFLFPHELEALEEETKLQSLLIYWSAKETLYKMHGEKGLAFRERILIDPFEPDAAGMLHGKVTEYPEMDSVDIHYEAHDWGYLTWAILNE